MAIRWMEAAYGKQRLDKRKVQIATIYARTQRFGQAVTYLDAANQQNPSPKLIFEKGRMLYDAGRYQEAMAVLESCTEMNP